MTAKKKSTGTPLRSEQRGAALEEYEKGIRLLQQKDFQKAIPRFEAVLSQFPEEAALCDRAHAYLKIARREGHDRKPLRQTRNPGESFEVGVFLLNEGETKEALRHLERAAEHEPEDARIHVSLAAARLAAGDRAGCMASLHEAFKVDSGIKYQVRVSSDFDELEEDEDFDVLVHGD